MIQAYRVHVNKLEEALRDMNTQMDFHKPKVIMVDKIADDRYMVLVQSNCAYPCRESKWKELL